MKKAIMTLSILTVMFLTVIMLSTGVSASGGTGSADYADALIDLVSPVIHEFGGSVDVSSLNISLSELSNVATLLNYYGEFFNIEGIRYSPSGDIIGYLYFSYNCTPQVYNVNLKEFRAAAAKLLDGIADSGLSDEYKALVLHDRIAVSCEYASSTADTVVFSSYGCIVNHEAVCNGYTYAYKYLLNRLGIRSDICISESMNHTWNILYINDLPYHVDVTWDDPTYDVTGRVEHKYFLLSSDGLYKTRNNGATDFDHTPQDTTYDAYYWQDSSAEFQLLDGDLYFVDKKAEMIRRIRNGKITDVASVADKWRASANSTWPGNFTRLSSTGEDLLYSLSEGIYMYDLSAGSAALIHAPEIASGDYRRIYGFTYSGGNLIYELYSSPNYTKTTKAQYQVIVPYEFGPCNHNFEDGFCTHCGIPGGECGENLIWEFDTETGTLTISGEGEMTDYNSSTKKAPWSDYANTIGSLEIASGVTGIGDYAFYYCTGLNFVPEFPESLERIGESAFEGCFFMTGEPVLPDGVREIGSLAFFGCEGLTGDLAIPESLTELGDGAFHYCPGVTGFTGSSDAFQTQDGILYNADMTEVICCPTGKTGEIILPETVRKIGFGAFFMCENLTGTPVIPNGLIEIGEEAFEGCSGLTGSIVLPESVTTIGIGAFYNCSGLTDITIPETVTDIGRDAFFGCNELTVFCRPDSTAEEYAAENGITYEYIKDEITGDFDGDGEITSDDAVYLLYYTLLPDLYPISQEADFDGDGEITSDDAVYLLYYTLLPDLYPIE